MKSFVTLRGDWRDPDTSGTGYGTVISAQLPYGEYGPVLFQIGGSAGTMGLTVYYPNQNAASPVSFNYTFNLGASPGMAGTYMASNVINCTMLNSYRGIGIGAIDHTKVHECGTVRNVKGNLLFAGVAAILFTLVLAKSAISEYLIKIHESFPILPLKKTIPTDIQRVLLIHGAQNKGTCDFIYVYIGLLYY